MFANASAATWFLWIAGVAILLLYGIPLLVAPLAWARLLRWRIPADTELVVYLARCLGAVCIAVVLAAFHAASTPAEHPAVFNVIVPGFGLLTLVHVWGALTRTQPWTETAEIALYVALTLIAYRIRSGM